jgi:hypothetical protein
MIDFLAVAVLVFLAPFILIGVIAVAVMFFVGQYPRS